MRRWSVVAAACVAVVVCIAFIERFTPVRGGRTLEYCCLFVLAATAAWAARGAWRNLLVTLCSLLFGLAVLEGVVIAINDPKVEKRALATFDDSGLNAPRPVLGWGPSKSGTYRVVKTDDRGRAIYDARVTIDATRNRATSPTGPGQIAFFGDSLVFGDGVGDADTLPQAFSDLNGGKIPVLNLAFSGWSPAQNLAALQQGLYRDVIEAPRHFVLFTSAFHIERTACKGAWASGTAPRFARSRDGVTYSGPCAGPTWSKFVHIADRFALYRRIAGYFGAPTKADADTYLAIVEEFVRTAKRLYGVDTTIFYEPTGDDYSKTIGYSEDQLIAAWRKAGLDVLVDRLPPIPDPARYWIPQEGHPTALAYKAMARQIQDHLEKVDPAALAPTRMR